MTLSDYITFVEVAKSSSLTLAAESLHLTTSAVSHAISRMENEFGFPLFSRTNRKVRLTLYGKTLLPFAEDILSENKKFMEQVDLFQGLKSGIVRIGTISSICINWLPEIINNFRKKYPDVEIQLRAGACNSEILNWLLDNEIDIGIGTTDPAPGLIFETLHEDEMVVITPPDCKTDNGYISASELKSMPLLMQEPPYNEEVVKILNKLKISMKSTITGYDDHTLVSMAEGGMGCCIFGKLVMRRTSASVAVHSFNPKIYRNISLIVKSGIIQSEAVVTMCKCIKRYASNFPVDYELTLLK
ncbi:MAG: LysR family transcriptional regulator [Eubacterium sp.]|nr:LysR family transcriptional regulator [Eubacterium sp.]